MGRRGAHQVALVGDVLGAIPDQGLIELAADAAGNPLILTEAFRGLRDENAIVVRGGHASLSRPSGAHVTSRIEALARHRLKGLSVRARQFVETASILGSSSRLEDVGEMLGESPGAMLAALDEALSAYLLTPPSLSPLALSPLRPFRVRVRSRAFRVPRVHLRGPSR